MLVLRFPPWKSVTSQDSLLILYSFSSFWALFPRGGKTKFREQNSRRPPDYSSNLCPSKTFAM